MEIIKYSNLVIDELKKEQFSIPYFVCTNSHRVFRRFEESEYRMVSVNKDLSRLLLNYPSDERCQRVEDTLKGMLNKQESLLISDFEMLFDPRYEIDVVKFFCDQARVNNIAVKWPGAFTGSKLTYAEPDDPDYHEYNCDTYQMRIVL